MMIKSFNLDNQQKQETLSQLLYRCQIKPADGTDLLEEPFSWLDFHQGETCTESLFDIDT